MRVKVLLFGQLRDLAGKSEEEVSLADGAKAADIAARYAKLSPKLAELMPSVALAVNQEYAAREKVLRDGDEVALLPPVSGGAPETKTAAEAYVRIVRERIVPHDIVPPLEKPEDGAIVLFDGIVRDNSRGRKTQYLVYEAYEEMALRQLEQLAEDAKKKFAIRNVLLVHRLGRLEIGESSVLIAVYSAHRAAAFDACRWLIDTLKKTVPIWKKEHFADGAVWADGEAFPPEVMK